MEKEKNVKSEDQKYSIIVSSFNLMYLMLKFIFPNITVARTSYWAALFCKIFQSF